MKKELIKNVLRGTVYYVPVDDETGEIRILTFGGVTEEETKGLSKVDIDAAYLLEYMEGDVNLSELYLHIDEEGVATFRIHEKQISDSIYANVFDIAKEGTLRKHGIQLEIDGQGGALVNAKNTKIIANPSTVIYFYATLPNNQNALIWQHEAPIVELKDYKFENLPTGTPGEDYDIWVWVPKGEMEVVWVMI